MALALHDRLEATTALAASVLGTLRLAQGLIEADRQVDLAGIEDRVGLLCASALDLPPEQGRGVRPDLFRVVQAIDALAASLRARPPA